MPAAVLRPAAKCLRMGAVRPAQPIQSWLASLAEHLARYDNQVVSDALKGGPWTPECTVL